MATQEQVNTQTPQTLTQKTLSAPVISGGVATADPTVPLGLATKQYVDAAGGGGGGTTLKAGIVEAYAGTTPPEGWLICDGVSYLNADYPELFAAIGILYGSVDSTHFNVPDLRGYFVRGLDAGRGIDTGRVLGSNQDDAFESHAHPISFVANLNQSGVSQGAGTANNATIGSTTDATGGTETRPLNVAMIYIISTGLGSGVGSDTLPAGYLFGFSCANNTTDPVNDLDVSRGVAKAADDANDLTTISLVVKQLDVAFAEYVAPGTPSGGRDPLDTLLGTPQTYHVHEIGGTGKNTQPFLSTSLNPTLPAGFTFSRRVWSILWSGTAIIAFVQHNRTCIFNALQETPATITGAASNVTIAGLPAGIITEAILQAFSRSNSADTTGLRGYDPATSDIAVIPFSDARASFGLNLALATDLRMVGTFRAFSNALSQVRFINYVASQTAIAIALVGYVDDADMGVIGGGTILTAPRAGTPLVMNPYTISTSVSQAHGLGAVPDYVKMELECLIAENGYQVGDIVDCGPLVGADFSETALGRTFSTIKSLTVLRCATAGGTFFLVNPSTPGTFAFTAANWKLTATPYKLT